MPFSKETARIAAQKKHSTRKSNDSKLADAAAAREADRKRHNSDLESIVPQVEDAIARKQEAGASTQMVQLSKDSLDQLLANINTLTTKVAQLERLPARVLEEPAAPANMKCSSCGQSLRACKSNHAIVFVGPRDGDLWKFFTGVNWNGVKYGGRCVVPAEAVQDILAQIGQWEMAERRRLIPGGKVFSDIDMKSALQGRTAII